MINWNKKGKSHPIGFKQKKEKFHKLELRTHLFFIMAISFCRKKPPGLEFWMVIQDNYLFLNLSK